MRCPDCGALNPDAADWCTQCYRRFDGSGAGEADAGEAPGAEASPSGTAPAAADPDAGPRPSDPGPGPSDVAPGPSDVAPGPSDVAPGPSGPTPGPSDAAPRPSGPDPRDDRPAAPASTPRDVRERAGVVEWRCSRCEGWAPIEMATCPTCGAPRTGFGPDTEPRPLVDDAPVVGASIALPGLGHLLAGHVGSGIARLGLALLWLGGGIALLVGAGDTVSRLPGLVLLAGVAVLWVGGVLDARDLAQGSTHERLGARVLLWLVVGVTVALIAALFLATVARV